MESLKQARHLLFTADGTYRLTTTVEMAELKRLLDEAGKFMSRRSSDWRSR